jgi:uncharacterized membrane protein
MKVSRRDLEWAVLEGVISRGQAEDLWRALEGSASERPRFNLAHVAYYFGALVVISAMGWFMTLGWERFGGGGILATSLVYATCFVYVGGRCLWTSRSLSTGRITDMEMDTSRSRSSSGSRS